MDAFHKPALLQEVTDALNIQNGKQYIDATLGGGGHSIEILKRGGKVLGIDVDQEAIEHVQLRIKNSKFRIGEDVVLVRGNFRDIDKIAHLHKFEKVSGILFDLGLSSHQVDDPMRGFSLQRNGPLDMRSDKSLGVTAADLLNALSKKELSDLFIKFGQEPKALTIAQEIVNARLTKPLETTDELVEIIEKVYGVGGASSKIRAKVGKRVFQALRIAVNTEIKNLEEALSAALGLLEKGGRILLISFHSLEDRIVKDAFNTFAKQGSGYAVTKKPIIPTFQEIKQNRRSRSAKLRVFEKI